MSWMRFLHRKRSDSELQDEIDTFLTEEAAENEARGMSPDEARRQARLKFGNPQKVRESLWEQNSPRFLSVFARDVKYACRTLGRTPGFSVISVVVIALCLGAATSLFTIVRSVLLRPLPFRDAQRLVVLHEYRRGNGTTTADQDYTPIAAGDFYEWRPKTQGFEDMAILRFAGYNFTGERSELPELIRAVAVSWNWCQMLGVQPAYGRAFTEAEDRPGVPVVMLTWSLFQRRFAGDPAIVGRQIHLDRQPFTVVGVLPSWFTYPDAGIQLLLPYQTHGSKEFLARHDIHTSQVIAKLRPDVPLASAVAQTGALQYQIHLRYPNDPVAQSVAAQALNEDLAGNIKRPLSLMMGAVGCMMFIGCLNLANLLVARGAARQREVAIRSALGARRATLMCQQLTESLLICLAGGAVGIFLSVLATRILTQSWKSLPNAQGIYIDAEVFAFACALILATALIAGILPALSGTGKAILNPLQASARSGSGSVARTGLRKVLLTAEIGITVVLLVCAGLLLKSFLRLRSAEVGCVTRNVLTLKYTLPYDTPEKVNAFNDGLLARIKAIPGVHAAALGNIMPGMGYGGDYVFTVREHPPIQAGDGMPEAVSRWVDPGYFSALGIPLLSGRIFSHDDRVSQSYKVIVSNQLVRQYFPDDNPIGKHLLVPAHPHRGVPGDTDYEIVGVVGDTLYLVGKAPKATIYFPILEGPTGGANIQRLAVVSETDPLRFASPVQKAVASLDPELPVSEVRTLEQAIDISLVNSRLCAWITLAFALLSLLLASVGLYGVLSYLATQRTAEFGIRMALGAQRSQVLKGILLDGLRPALLGLGLGLLLSIAATRVFQSMLFGTKPLDPIVLSGVIATLLGVSVLACLVPAWRASRIDPMQALRTE